MAPNKKKKGRPKGSKNSKCNCHEWTELGVHFCPEHGHYNRYRQSEDEPQPRPGKKVVLHYVIKDLKARAKEGKKKFGALLETENGRDALIDAYQEALDSAMYLRQTILERDTEAIWRRP